MKERIYLFDNLKCLLIILVVVGHFIDGGGTNEYRSMRALFVFIYAFHMPLFLFVSGLFTKRKDQLDISRVLSFVCIGFVLKIAIAFISFVFGRDVHFSLLSDAGVAWFMFALAAYLVLAWLLRNSNKTVVLGLSVSLALAVGYDSSVGDFLYLSRIIVFFPFFWLGYCLDPQEIVKFTRKPSVRVMSISVVLIFALMCILCTNEVYAYRSMFTGRNPYSGISAIEDCSWINRLIALSLSTILSIGFISLVPNRAVPFFTAAGKRTLQVFFWHQPLLDCLRYAGVQVFVQTAFPVYWPYLWCLIAMLIVAILVLKCFGIPLRPLVSIGRSRHIS